MSIEDAAEDQGWKRQRRDKSNVIVFPTTRKAHDVDQQVERQRQQLAEPESDDRDIEWVRALLADFRNRHQRSG